jgi:peptidoglycan/xylan/chitin deacetylase (PgdA/CDA1 family)
MGITDGRRLLPFLLLPLALAAASACGAPSAQAQHVSAGCSHDRRIALTFDDGPNPPYTPQLLDTLRAGGARATFFDEGEAAAADPADVRREIAAGMAVGSHSFSHSKSLPTMPRAEFAADLARAEDVLTQLLGSRPALYRAPYGHTSHTMLRALRHAGYVSIGWDVDSGDWRGDATPDTIVANVLTHAHPGAIVLMHDGGLGGGNPDRSAIVQALPRIVEALHQQGYDLVTVPELTGLPWRQGETGTGSCLAS